jgi:fibronectin-binding autotransporter adhesin
LKAGNPPPRPPHLKLFSGTANFEPFFGGQIAADLQQSQLSVPHSDCSNQIIPIILRLNMKRILFLSGIPTVVVILALPAAGQSTWNGTTGNTAWSNAASWNPAGVPAAGANIIIADATASTLALDGAVSRSVGSITFGTTGTRTAGFDGLQTNANTLTINGGFIANGNFTGVGPRLRSSFVIGANQIWQVAGEVGTTTGDRGVVFQERSGGNRGNVLLNANLTKTGSGMLMFAGTTIDGPGDLIVNQGSLKLNAGASLELRAIGTGKFIINNDAQVQFSKNTGTFGDATTFNRAFQFNGTSRVFGGGGQNGTWIIPSPMEWNGTHEVNLNVGTIDYHFTGVQSGPGALTKSGVRQLTLGGSGHNTRSGLTTVTGGELRLQKDADITAIAGDLLLTGGIVRMLAAGQIADTAAITVNGGQFINDTGRTDTVAAITLNATPISSFSNMTVTGATTITAGTHDVYSGYNFATNSLAISNGAIRHGANAGNTTISVGPGGLTLANGSVIFGSAGGAVTAQLNLAGNLSSSGASALTPPNYLGPRITDLQGGTRTFAVADGTLNVRTAVQNGTLQKSGPGTLRLESAGSTADFAFTGGDVEIAGAVDAGNVALSSGALRIDIGGATPAKMTTTGNFTATGGTIEVTINNGTVSPGLIELVRYGGSLPANPVVNLPAAFVASRMAPVLGFGDGSADAITITTTGVPADLVWSGAAGDDWDIETTANFNGGAETFFALDNVTFNDSALNPDVTLDAQVFPSLVTFAHGDTVPLFTVTGDGGITGSGGLAKSGTGTTILAVDNSYGGPTTVSGGKLQIGNGGPVGAIGAGAITVTAPGTLAFARSGTVTLPNALAGDGVLEQAGPGTLVIPDNKAFTGTVSVSGGTLQLGNGGAVGTLGGGAIDVAAGATLAFNRSGTPTYANLISGGGGVAILSGGPVLGGANSFTGGVTVSGEAHLRLPVESGLGAVPDALVADSVILQNGGLKNQDSDPVVHENRGLTLAGDGYFTAGWTKTLTIAGPLTGTGNVFINWDSGRVIFTNPNSDWNGILTLGGDKSGFNGATGGRLQVAQLNNAGQPGPLGTASADSTNLVFRGGSLIYTGATTGWDRGATLETSATIEITEVATDAVFSGFLTGPGTLTKTGAGRLILSAGNDFAGQKTISAGGVVLRDPLAFGSTAGQILFTGTAGVLDLELDESAAPYPVTIGAGNAGTILANVATSGAGITHTLGNLTLSSVTLNVAAGANVNGGDPRAVFPDLNLSAGTSGATTLNPTSANITLGNASIGSNAALKTLILGGTSQDNRVTGTIANGLATFSLRKENDSLWTISGDNSFTGNVVVDDGVLVITHGNALGASTKTVQVAGNAAGGRIPELRLSGGITATANIWTLSGNGIAATGAVRNLAGNNTLIATGRINIASGNGNLTLYSDAGTFTVTAPVMAANAADRALLLAGPGDGVVNASVQNGSTASLPVTKNGGGTWALNGPHSYTGPTTVNAGVLSLGQAGLDDNSTVNIASGAVLDLNFTGTDTIAALNLGGNPVGPGTYNAAHPLYSAYFSGTGSLKIPGATTPFEDWIADKFPELTGNDALPGADPDGDGVANLLEFMLNADPTDPASTGKSTFLAADTNATPGDELILVLALRAGAVFGPDGNNQAQIATIDELDCSVAGSLDLAAFNAVVETLPLPLAPALTAGLPAPDAGWEYRAFRLAGSDGLPDRGFLRFQVSE